MTLWNCLDEIYVPCQVTKSDEHVIIIWLKYYINLIEINEKLINDIANKDFDLIQIDYSHQLAILNCYIFFKIIRQYFFKLIYKKKNT